MDRFVQIDTDALGVLSASGSLHNADRDADRSEQSAAPQERDTPRRPLLASLIHVRSRGEQPVAYR
ncbi:hypothetical protein GCM10018966_041190 [Streptomyces yanii]